MPQEEPREPRADVPAGAQPGVDNFASDDKDRALRRVKIERTFGERNEAKPVAKARSPRAEGGRRGGKGGREEGFPGPGNAGGGDSAGKGIAGGASIDDLLNEAPRGEQQRFAPPPPARAADGVGRVGGAKKKSVADEADDFARPTPAPAASATAPRAKREEESLSKEAESAPMAAEAAEEEGLESAPQEQKRKKAPSKPASAPAATAGPSPMVQRADQLFAQGQWSAAALAYRALLSRDPRNADAPRWRQRLLVAEHQVEVEAAKAATKAKPADDGAP